MLLPDREELSDEAIVTMPVEEALLLALLGLARVEVLPDPALLVPFD